MNRTLAALSDPVFVNVGGEGFKPDSDTLAAPLPVEGGKPVKPPEK